MAKGSRGRSVKQLTSTNCTEEERFIFDFLEKKRERKATLGVDSSEGLSSNGVDDDEFDAYLDSLGGKKKDKKNSADADEYEDDELDFMTDFGEPQEGKSKKSKKTSEEDENDDWDSDNDGESDDGSDVENMDEEYVIKIRQNNLVD